jgi:hypothetical protein
MTVYNRLVHCSTLFIVFFCIDIISSNNNSISIISIFCFYERQLYFKRTIKDKSVSI